MIRFCGKPHGTILKILTQPCNRTKIREILLELTELDQHSQFNEFEQSDPPNQFPQSGLFTITYCARPALMIIKLVVVGFPIERERQSN